MGMHLEFPFEGSFAEYFYKVVFCNKTCRSEDIKIDLFKVVLVGEDLQCTEVDSLILNPEIFLNPPFGRRL